MYCTKCGHEIKEEQKFCIYCGNKLQKELPDDDPLVRTETKTVLKQNFNNKRKRRKKKRGILLAVLLAGGVIFCLFLFVFLKNKGENGTSDIPIFSGDETLYYEDTDLSDVVRDEKSGVQYAGNELILTSHDGISREKIKEIVQQYGGTIIGYIQITDTYQIQFQDSCDLQELKSLGEDLCQYEEIDNAEVNFMMDMEVEAYPNDSEWKNQWDSIPDGSNWGMEAIHAPEAWEYIDQMENVNIGVYDSMFKQHEDLIFQEWLCNQYGMDFDSTHGVQVSGVIGATYNNRKGICGVFPKAQIYGVSYKKAGKHFAGDGIMALKAGLTYLISGKNCKVINMSVAWEDLVFAANQQNADALEITNQCSQNIGDYLEILLNKGNDFVICKAAGNQNSLASDNTYKYVRADEGDLDAYYGYIKYCNENEEKYGKYTDDFENRIEFGNVNVMYDFIASIPNPEIKDRIIVVGSVKNEGNDTYSVSNFSNCGTRVDIVAPGENIYSTYIKIYDKLKESLNNQWHSEEYAYDDGTSLATPFVSGVAAMLFSLNPELSGAQVKEIICDTARGEMRYTGIMEEAMSEYSYPLLDAEAAVIAALEKKESGDDAVQEAGIEIEDSNDELHFRPFINDLVAKYGLVKTTDETRYKWMLDLHGNYYNQEVQTTVGMGILSAVISNLDNSGRKELLVCSLESNSEDSRCTDFVVTLYGIVGENQIYTIGEAYRVTINMQYQYLYGDLQLHLFENNGQKYLCLEEIFGEQSQEGALYNCRRRKSIIKFLRDGQIMDGSEFLIEQSGETGKVYEDNKEIYTINEKSSGGIYDNLHVLALYQEWMKKWGKEVRDETNLTYMEYDENSIFYFHADFIESTVSSFYRELHDGTDMRDNLLTGISSVQTSSIDIADYFNYLNTNPGHLIPILGLKERTPRIWPAESGEDAECYYSEGLTLEWIGPRDYMPDSQKYLTNVHCDEDENYVIYGLGCGKNYTDGIDNLLQNGWNCVYENETGAEYYKYEGTSADGGGRLIHFDFYDDGDTIKNWWWLNWPQGDFRSDDSDGEKETTVSERIREWEDPGYEETLKLLISHYQEKKSEYNIELARNNGDHLECFVRQPGSGNDYDYYIKVVRSMGLVIEWDSHYNKCMYFLSEENIEYDAITDINSIRSEILGDWVDEVEGEVIRFTDTQAENGYYIMISEEEEEPARYKIDDDHYFIASTPGTYGSWEENRFYLEMYPDILVLHTSGDFLVAFRTEGFDGKMTVPEEEEEEIIYHQPQRID